MANLSDSKGNAFKIVPSIVSGIVFLRKTIRSKEKRLSENSEATTKNKKLTNTNTTKKAERVKNEIIFFSIKFI